MGEVYLSGAFKTLLSHPDLDASTNIARAEVYTRLWPAPAGKPGDLFAVTERIDRRLLPALRIDCGTEDDLLDGNRRFHEHLEALAIPHEYEEYPGGHTWAYWDQHIQEALAFHHRVFSSVE